jgi:hypothetical protein
VWGAWRRTVQCGDDCTARQNTEGPMTPGSVFHMTYLRLASLDFGPGTPDLLLALYKPWRPDVAKARQMLGRVANATGGVGEVVVADMDTALNFADPAVFNGCVRWEVSS